MFSKLIKITKELDQNQEEEDLVFEEVEQSSDRTWKAEKNNS